MELFVPSIIRKTNLTQLTMASPLPFIDLARVTEYGFCRLPHVHLLRSCLFCAQYGAFCYSLRSTIGMVWVATNSFNVSSVELNYFALSRIY